MFLLDKYRLLRARLDTKFQKFLLDEDKATLERIKARRIDPYKSEFDSNNATADQLLKYVASTKKQVDGYFYQMIGRALSHWAGVEVLIVLMVSRLLRADPNKTGILMYSNLNFGAWIMVASDLFELDEDFSHLKPRWNKLSGQLRQLTGCGKSPSQNGCDTIHCPC